MPKPGSIGRVGALAGGTRRFDPWPLFDVVYDHAGVRNAGRPYYKLAGGRRVPDLRSVPNTTFTRATTAIVRDADGSLRQVASGEPAIGRGRGLELWPTIQNKNANNNFAPTIADWSVSGAGTSVAVVARANLPGPVLAALNAIDPTGLVSAVIKTTFINDGSPGTVQVPGGVGNLNTHTASAYAYVESVSGSVQFGFIGLTVPELTEIAAPTTAFVRLSNTTTAPLSTNRRMGYRAGTGGAAVIYSFGEVLTETTYVPPVIPVSGASAFRNGDEHAETGFVPNPAGMTFYFEGAFNARLENSYVFEISNGGSGERVLVQSNTSDIIRLTIISNAGGTDFVAGPTLLTSAKLKGAARWNGSIWDLFINGVKYTNAGADTLPSGLSQINLGQRLNGAEKQKGPQAVFARAMRAIPDAVILPATAL